MQKRRLKGVQVRGAADATSKKRWRASFDPADCWLKTKKKSRDNRDGSTLFELFELLTTCVTGWSGFAGFSFLYSGCCCSVFVWR